MRNLLFKKGNRSTPVRYGRYRERIRGRYLPRYPDYAGREKERCQHGTRVINAVRTVHGHSTAQETTRPRKGGRKGNHRPICVLIAESSPACRDHVRWTRRACSFLRPLDARAWMRCTGSVRPNKPTERQAGQLQAQSKFGACQRPPAPSFKDL